jgi:glucose-6-phosphate isomerase
LCWLRILILGLLREIANENPEVRTFSVPDKVGGRFSVLSSVGLLPAALIGVDVRSLVKGALKMRDIFLSADAQNNLAFQIAALQFLFYSKWEKYKCDVCLFSKIIKTWRLV